VKKHGLKILTEPYSLTYEQVKLVEKEYDAKYICCLEGNELFYSKEPHKDSKSRYFIMFWKYNNDGKNLLIASGQKYEGKLVCGYIADHDETTNTGTVLYSRDRHDFYSYGNITVDGGPFSPRVLYNGTPPPFVRMMVVDGKLIPFDVILR
jgi:hypothetical protein